MYLYLGGGGPRVVVSTAAFHDRVRGSVPGLGGLKETKLFLPHPRVKLSIVGSLRDREVACSALDRQGSNFESCVWRTVSSHLSHHPQDVLLAQFSLYVHKGGLKPDSSHFFCILGSVSMQIQSCYSCLYNILPPFSVSVKSATSSLWGISFFLLGPCKHLHKTFNQCCFNVRPASPSLAHHCETNSSNNFYRVCWVHSQRLRLSWRCGRRNFAAIREVLSN